MDVPRAAEPLYALPPSRFTRERDALAKQLAEEGDPAAAAVRKLPRPLGLAWVLNRLARERPLEVEALIAAGERLRSGQRRALSGRGADELRVAEEELRGRARALRSEADRILATESKAASPAALGRLELLLRVTAPLPGAARDALARGVLAREPGIASGELAGFAVLQGGPGTRVRSATARSAPGGGRFPREARRKASDRDRDGDARAREKREKARRERQRLAERARREAEAARARAEREERSAAGAAERADAARRRAADARAEADRLAARARELERAP